MFAPTTLHRTFLAPTVPSVFPGPRTDRLPYQTQQCLCAGECRLAYHQAAHALGDLVNACSVAVRAILAKTGNRGVDQPRVDLPKAVIINTKPEFYIGPIIFNENVCICYQLL